ncbi:IS66 family insertion sequence element accessory protein TnpB, partial [Variovorax sp. RTB1]|uniref:IS66 family insertion sequence element accessory protein TnpB n=1 Tax=Variovorax sp. RTB1 TaxID=3048631 RepID=UPI002B238B98
EAIWLATEPIDMRAGVDTALARVVKVFGAAKAHHAYLFANCVFRRSVTGGFGIVTDDFGNVTGNSGDVTEEVSSQI